MDNRSSSAQRRPRHASIRGGFLAALCTMALLAASVAHATITLVPSGLSSGDKYHLAFLTSTQLNATSASIATYDAHVQAAADAANLGIGSTMGFGDITWKAIGSTATVNAIDHVVLTGPLYRLDDVLVAISTADLYDGTLLAPISRTEEDDGVDYNSSTWTGTIVGGTKHDTFFLGASNAGSFSRSLLGHSGQIGSTWINANSNIIGNMRRLYAISQEFTAPGTVAVEEKNWSAIKALYRP